MCLDAKRLVLPEEPIMLDSSMSHQRKMWDLRATVTFKNEELRKQNQRSLYTGVMLCCAIYLTRCPATKILPESSILGAQSSFYRSSSNLCNQTVVQKFTWYRAWLQSTWLEWGRKDFNHPRTSESNSQWWVRYVGDWDYILVNWNSGNGKFSIR